MWNRANGDLCPLDTKDRPGPGARAVKASARHFGGSVDAGAIAPGAAFFLA
jgi:hypothetical protein